MQLRAASPWPKFQVAVLGSCHKVTDKGFIASAEHCKSLSAVNLGRCGKVAVAAEQPVDGVDAAVVLVGDDVAVAIEQPAGADVAVEKPAVVESIISLTTRPLPSCSPPVHTLPSSSPPLRTSPPSSTTTARAVRSKRSLTSCAGLADLVDDAEAATAQWFMSLDGGRLEAAFLSASRELRAAGAAEQAGGRPAARRLAAAVGVYQAVAAAVDSRLPAIADTLRAIAAAGAP